MRLHSENYASISVFARYSKVGPKICRLHTNDQTLSKTMSKAGISSPNAVPSGAILNTNSSSAIPFQSNLPPPVDQVKQVGVPASIGASISCATALKALLVPFGVFSTRSVG